MSRLRLRRRFMARLAGEVRVYGLRAPARARWSDGHWRIEAEAPEDTPRVEGVVAAAHALVSLDLARRTWSGRLSELFGRRPLVGELDTLDHDLFVRQLGFRSRAEKAYRGLTDEPRRRLEQFAAGLNAWIDDGPWAADPVWAELDTRPRLFGAADVLLLAAGPILANRAAVSVEPGHPLADQVAARLGLLEHPVLRGADGFAAPLPGGLGLQATPGPLPVRFPVARAAQLTDERVLPGGDHHRVVAGDGWVRLSVTRPDVAVRGGQAARPWLRTAPGGPLVSDLFASGEDHPPTGRATSLAWECVDQRLVVEEAQSPPSVLSVRLVPLDEGA
jgi:hypothetical protein